MNINFEIRQSISAFIQVTGWSVSERRMVIEFPDGNKLIFDEASETFPPDLPLEPGSFNEDDHDILSDLDEWGFYEENVLYLDIDTLISDSALNPAMFVNSSDEPVVFNYDVFPTGVYKITLNTVDSETPGGGTEPPDPLAGGTSLSALLYSRRFFITNSFDQALVNAINSYFSSENRVHRKTLYLNLIEKIIVKEAALIDFNNSRYNEANYKLRALDQSQINTNLDYNYFVK